MISYTDYKKQLTPEQRAKVDELARKLIAEDKSKHETSENALPMDNDEPQESASV